MLPKLSFVGLGTSCPSATPVPVRDRTAGSVDASLVTESVATKLPAAFGVKTMLAVAF